MDINPKKHDEIKMVSDTCNETMKDYLLRLHDEYMEANKDLQQAFAIMDRIKSKVLAGNGRFSGSLATPEGWTPNMKVERVATSGPRSDHR